MAGIALLVTGIVLGALLSGLGVAGARTPSPSATPGEGHEWYGPGFHHGGPGRPEPGDGPPGPGFFGPGHRHGFGALHGQFTVPTPGGGSRTISFQVGTATSVSDSSITVKSDDGYTKSYALDDDTVVEAGLHGIGDVTRGDEVRVLAVGTGANARTVNVADETKLRNARGPLGGFFPGPPGGPPPERTPSPVTPA